MYIQLSPLLSGMVRESLKSSLRRSCCGEVRCEKEKNFCVDNFSELAQLLDFCSTRTCLVFVLRNIEVLKVELCNSPY